MRRALDTYNKLPGNREDLLAWPFDRPLRLRAKNIAPSTRGVGKPAKRVGSGKVHAVPRAN